MKTIRIATITVILFLVVPNAWGDAGYTWQEIPHLAFGGGWTSYLTLGNPHENVTLQTSLTVRLWDDNGNPLTANVEGFGLVSSFPVSLAPLEQKTFAITGGAQLSVGWVELKITGICQINASLKFSQAGVGANVSDAVGILASIPNYVWDIPVEKRGSSDDTGVAVVNPWSDAPVTVVFDLYQGLARVPGANPVSKTISAYGHSAVFVSQLFPGVSFSGVATMKISASTDSFCAVALKADGNQYSALPAASPVELWNWTFDDGTTVWRGQWVWRYIDGYMFVAWESHSWSDGWVYARGQVDGNYLILEWELYDSNSHGTGTVLFQGTISGGNTVSGKRTVVNSDGTVANSYPFSATRAH